MFHRMLAARFQDAIKPHQIAFHIRIRVGDRIAHTRLRRQVDDDAKAMPCKERLEQRRIRNVAPHEFQRLPGFCAASASICRKRCSLSATS